MDSSENLEKYYHTGSSCMGKVNNEYFEFVSDSEYREYLRENEKTK